MVNTGVLRNGGARAGAPPVRLVGQGAGEELGVSRHRGVVRGPGAGDIRGAERDLAPIIQQTGARDIGGAERDLTAIIQ